jgi:hypothetical protein
MKNVNIKINKKRYKLGQLVKMMNGDVEAMRDMIAQNMIGSNGEYLETSVAVAILDDLDGDQIDELQPMLLDALTECYKEAVPLATSGK